MRRGQNVIENQWKHVVCFIAEELHLMTSRTEVKSVDVVLDVFVAMFACVQSIRAI